MGQNVKMDLGKRPWDNLIFSWSRGCQCSPFTMQLAANYSPPRYAVVIIVSHKLKQIIWKLWPGWAGLTLCLNKFWLDISVLLKILPSGNGSNIVVFCLNSPQAMMVPLPNWTHCVKLFRDFVKYAMFFWLLIQEVIQSISVFRINILNHEIVIILLRKKLIRAIHGL